MQNGIVSFNAASFMADCTFGILILGFLVRLVWYAKEIVDSVKQVIVAQAQQQITVEKHEVAIAQHSTEIAVLKAATGHSNR